MRKPFILIFIFFSIHAYAIDLYGVYPTNWWVGMKNPKLQLMIHGKNIGLFTKVSINYAGVAINGVTHVSNKNYLFIDLSISAAAKPGNFKVIMSGGGPASED